MSNRREVVGSSPTVVKDFSFCYSRFLRVPHSLTKRFLMKSPVGTHGLSREYVLRIPSVS